jgi:hypothetical protein
MWAARLLWLRLVIVLVLAAAAWSNTYDLTDRSDAHHQTAVRRAGHRHVAYAGTALGPRKRRANEA